jgi:tRNA threonylcarbamoyladenosine biosynthesis protein TsaB
MSGAAGLTLLAFDTSTRACSVALAAGGAIDEDYRLIPREHNRALLPMIDGLLRRRGVRLADLDAIVFGRGPGSFTGLRIATGVAQGLAFGAARPVLGVSTLACLAQGFLRRTGSDRCFAAMHAREREIYCGAYVADDGVMRSAGGDRLVAVDELGALDGGPWGGAGDGWQFEDGIRARLGVDVVAIDAAALPAARDLIPLAAADWQAGRAVEGTRARPVYLREIVAEKAR